MRRWRKSATRRGGGRGVKLPPPWRATRRGAETHQNRNTAAEPAALQCAEDFLQDEYPHEQYKTDPECRRSGFRVSR